MLLTNNELVNISGGGYKWCVILGAAMSFIIGIIDGYIRPLKCN